MRSPSTHCDLSRLRLELGRPVLFGHRGMPGDRIENRIAAFREALVRGADGIECDLQLTADGVPVVVHDGDLMRVTGTSGEVRKSTAAQLRDLGLPCLEDLLQELPPHAILNLEIKEMRLASSGLEAAVVDSVARYGAQSRVVYSSFSPFAIARLRQLDPRCHAGLLIAPGMRHGQLAARFASATAIHAHAAQVNETMITAWRRGNYRIVVWGDRDPHELARIKAMDIDAIITDHVGGCVN